MFFNFIITNVRNLQSHYCYGAFIDASFKKFQEFVNYITWRLLFC